ncbi:kinase [Kroppenstedtia pulmonis]|uniref:Kinase n=1 Tax=Kroppenstedtia pulmonis TaxID=1380685 RepID=A0A7D4BJU6_9BACL|nr:kinase [Kroppenstedtia pulmonis]
MLLVDPSNLAGAKGRGSSFGTFGELLQGVDDEGADFLVTFPVNRNSYAVFTVDVNQRKVTVIPSFKEKSRLLAEQVLKHYGIPFGGTLEITSDLPVGKGLASSSADLVATARALEDCLNLVLPQRLLDGFMEQIEPSDGVMYPGVVSFYHRKVKLREFLGPLPGLTVVGIDEGGEVDTIQFNRVPKPFSTVEKAEYKYLLEKMSAACRNRDLKTIGSLSTRSAVLNQKLRPKKLLEAVITQCREIGGLGVIVAHSGTCLGVLLNRSDPNYTSQLQQAVERLEKVGNEVDIYHSWSQPDSETEWFEEHRDTANRLAIADKS